jgi:hypothetical protein
VSPQPRLWIGGILRSASERIRARANGEAREVVQLKAALQRNAAEVANPGSRDELLTSLGRVLETTFAIAATQGVSRIELEARLRPAVHARSVFGHVSQLRSSVVRVARDGSVRVTTRLNSRLRAREEAEALRRRPEPASPSLAAATSVSARGISLQETVTVVTQRFLGARGSSVTHLRSFTRIVPVTSAWTVDAISLRWLRTGFFPEPPVQTNVAAKIDRVAAPAIRPRKNATQPPITSRTSDPPSAKMPTFVLRSRSVPLQNSRWLRRPEQQATTTPRPQMGLVLPGRVQLATRAELAAWAVSATSRLIVERLLLPYLRRLAAQRATQSKGKLLWELGSIVVPLGLRLVANNSVRNN